MSQETHFTIPFDPSYSESIRRMRTTDAVHANVVNDWLQPVVNNVHRNHLDINENSDAIESINKQLGELDNAVETHAGSFTAVNARIDNVRQVPAGGSPAQVLTGAGWQSLPHTSDLTVVGAEGSIHDVETSFAWLDEPQYDWVELCEDLPEQFDEPITFAVAGGEFWSEELGTAPAQIIFHGQRAMLMLQAKLSEDGEAVHLTAEKMQSGETINYRYDWAEGWLRQLSASDWALVDNFDISITAHTMELIHSSLADWRAILGQQVIYSAGLNARMSDGSWQFVGPSVVDSPSACSGGTNARLLTEGIDYTAEIGQATETVNYLQATMENPVRWWNGGSFRFNASTFVGQVVLRHGHFWLHHHRNRVYPEDLADVSDVRLVLDGGHVLNVAVSDVENIYCMDNNTIRSTILTATGEFPGLSFQMKMAIGHNFENPAVTAYIDQLYFMLTVTAFDSTVFSNTFGSELNIGRVDVILPPINRTYRSFFGGLIRLHNGFEVPEQLTAKIRVRYAQENMRRYGTATFSCTINPHTAEEFSRKVLDDEIPELELDLSNVVTCKDSMGVYMEFVRIAHARNVHLLCPNWNWDGRVVGLEVLELWKKFEQPGR